MRSQRKLGLSTEQFPVSAYVGNWKHLKDLKDVEAIDGTFGPRGRTIYSPH